MLKIYHILILFFLIFNFRVPLFHNSILLSFFMILPLLLFGQNYLNIFTTFLKTKFFFRLLSISILLIIWFVIFAKLQGTFDYSFSMRLTMLTIGLVISIMFLSITSNQQLEKNNYLLKLLFIIFSIQGLIQILGLINHDFFEFIQLFHNQDDSRAVSEIAKFGGLRGGALAGDLFFSLSISYGLIFFLYVKFIIDKESFQMIDGLNLLLYLIGMFTSARIGYLGVLLSFIYFLIVQKVDWNSRIYSFFKFFFYLLSLISIVYFILPDNILDIILNKLLPFAFEFLYNYVDKGDFSTASTSHLSEEMFIYPSTLETWFVGDGRMVGLDGKYYMHTDAGYSRILFYFGIYGIIILFLYQLLFFPYKNYEIKGNFFLEKNYFKTSFLIFFYIALINIKGMALGIIVSINLIIIFSLFDIRQFYNKELMWEK